MKQIYILPLFIFTIVILSGCSNQGTNNTIETIVPIHQSEIENTTKTYYEDFRKKCRESSCCLSSVDRAERFSSLIYEVDGLSNVDCPDGFTSNMLKCVGSYKWCSPEN